MEDTLAGRIVLVTGASSGIGRSIALACAAAGADLILTYRTSVDGAGAVAHAVAALGRRVECTALDLADPSSIRALADVVRGTYGRVDAWVNNAGADILTGSAASRPVLEKLDALLTVDLRGTILASWTAADLLAEQAGGGVIINMSWDHVLAGMEGRNPQMFAAAKGGVLAFSKALARSIAPAVRVNVLAPGWIETAFGAGMDEARHDAIADATPLRRWGTPDDVAGAAVFLASPAAAFITGQTFLINGGVVM